MTEQEQKVQELLLSRLSRVYDVVLEVEKTVEEQIAKAKAALTEASDRVRKR
jgi:hypothetical protein